LKIAGEKLGAAREKKVRDIRYTLFCKRREDVLQSNKKTPKNNNVPADVFKEDDASSKYEIHTSKFNLYKNNSSSDAVVSCTDTPSDDDVPFNIRFKSHQSHRVDIDFMDASDKKQHLSKKTHEDLSWECDESEGNSETQSSEDEVNPRGSFHYKQSTATRSLRNKVHPKLKAVHRHRRKKSKKNK
jgi:ribosomal protein L25 (general stress protein Ctc)